MTHLPYNPWVLLGETLFIFLAISGLPTFYLVYRLMDWKPKLHYLIPVFATGWAVVWLKTSLKWAQHGRLQRQAARKSGCLGYPESAFPDACLEAMHGAHVIPENFFAWSAVAFGLSVMGLGVMAADGLKERYEAC